MSTETAKFVSLVFDMNLLARSTELCPVITSLGVLHHIYLHLVYYYLLTHSALHRFSSKKTKKKNETFELDISYIFHTQKPEKFDLIFEEFTSICRYVDSQISIHIRMAMLEQN